MAMSGGKFGPFLAAFPPLDRQPVDATLLAADVQGAFGVPAPADLVAFWREVGCGAFAGGELVFFGREGDPPPGSLVGWNREPFWRDLLPIPTDGGPVFFAEDCFGSQLGFRYTPEGVCLPVILTLGTVTLYKLAPEFARLFEEVLIERAAITDPEHLAAAREGVGDLPPGHWYCPIVSPLVGGSARAGNFTAMTRRAFAATTIAEWRATQSPP
jgi:hypothetical protein